jgi:hypothetical protein
MRAALVAIVVAAAAPARADSIVSLLGGHAHLTVPPDKAWRYEAQDAVEAIANGKAEVMVFLLPIAPDRVLDLSEQSEADDVGYGVASASTYGGLDGLLVVGGTKSGKGGGRRIFAAETCLGTVEVVETWEDDTPAKVKKQLDKIAASFTYALGSSGYFPHDKTYATLDAGARAAVDHAAHAVCIGSARELLALSAGSVEVDGTARTDAELGAAMARAGDPAAYLRMSAGQWVLITDKDQPTALGVARVPSKEAGDAEEETVFLLDRTSGSWKLTRIKRAAP